MLVKMDNFVGNWNWSKSMAMDIAIAMFMFCRETALAGSIVSLCISRMRTTDFLDRKTMVEPLDQ
jgi:hypothetical protein